MRGCFCIVAVAHPVPASRLHTKDSQHGSMPGLLGNDDVHHQSRFRCGEQSPFFALKLRIADVLIDVVSAC